MEDVVVEQAQPCSGGTNVVQADRQGVRQGKFTHNLFGNLANFVVNTLVGLCFVPYLVKHLGVAGYGLIPVTTTITSYLSILTLALNSAVGRYLTIEEEKGNITRANLIFNTSFWNMAAFAAILIPAGIVASKYVDHIIVVPSGYTHAARLLLIYTVATFVITELATPFSVATFCRNRFDIRSVVDISSTLLRVGSVVVVFCLCAPQIWHVGLGMVAAALLSAFLSVIIWRKLMPELHLSIGQYSWKTFSDLTGTGLWIAISQLGTLLLVSVDILVVNRFFSAILAGQYVLIIQWSTLLRSVAGTVAIVFTPTMLSLYARSDLKGLVSYSRLSVKFLGLMLALPVAVICGFSRPLLQLWIGPSFTLSPLLTFAIIFHLAVNLAYIPLHNIPTATNNVRLPGIVQIVAGVVNVLLAVILVKFCHMGLYGVAIAGAVVLSARNIIFTPIYAAQVIGYSSRTFMAQSITVLFVSLLFTGICWVISLSFDMSSWLRLGAASVAVSLVYLAFIVFCVLRKEEKGLLLKTIGLRGKAAQ